MSVSVKFILLSPDASPENLFNIADRTFFFNRPPPQPQSPLCSRAPKEFPVY